MVRADNHRRQEPPGATDVRSCWASSLEAGAHPDRRAGAGSAPDWEIQNPEPERRIQRDQRDEPGLKPRDYIRCEPRSARPQTASCGVFCFFVRWVPFEVAKF